MSKVKVNCETCNNELERLPYQIKASKTGYFFCNRDCKSLWHKSQHFNKREIFECPICKKEMLVTKYENNRRTYCSLDCLAKSKSLEGNTYYNCDLCGKKSSKVNSKMTEKNFCSKECSTKWDSIYSKRRVFKKCLTCKKPFEVLLSRKDTAKTCSRECHNKYLSVSSSEGGHLHEVMMKNILKGTSVLQKYDTLPERIVREELEKLNIKYEEQKEMYNKFIVDFYLPEYNIVLEVFGDYWHSNPQVYGYGEGLKEPNENQLKQIKKDKSRKGYLEKCGHKFVSLWEKDIYENPRNLININILKAHRKNS